jgi:hypothetical protein
MSTMDDVKVVTLRIQYDSTCDNPLESCDGMWTLHTFEGGWYGKGPTDFFTDRGGAHDYKWIPNTLDLFFKLRKGLAFMVGGYFHAGSSGTSACVQDFDPTDKIAGLLVWEHPESDMGAKTYEERKKDAEGTLDEYERWANGECFGFIFNEGEKDEDSCWGFVGGEYIAEAVAEDYLTEERPLRVVLVDDLTESVMGRALDKLDGVETMTLRQLRAEEEAYETLADEEDDELADSERLEMAS